MTLNFEEILDERVGYALEDRGSLTAEAFRRADWKIPNGPYVLHQISFGDLIPRYSNCLQDGTSYEQVYQNLQRIIDESHKDTESVLGEEIDQKQRLACVAGVTLDREVLVNARDLIRKHYLEKTK